VIRGEKRPKRAAIPAGCLGVDDRCRDKTGKNAKKGKEERTASRWGSGELRDRNQKKRRELSPSRERGQGESTRCSGEETCPEELINESQGTRRGDRDDGLHEKPEGEHAVVELTRNHGKLPNGPGRGGGGRNQGGGKKKSQKNRRAWAGTANKEGWGKERREKGKDGFGRQRTPSSLGGDGRYGKK